MLKLNFYTIVHNEANLILTKKFWAFIKEDLEDKQEFQKLFQEYFYEELCKDAEFMCLFNTERNYFIGLDNEIIGIINFHKGYTFMSFDNFDYRDLYKVNGLVLPQPEEEKDPNIEPIYPDKPGLVEPIYPNNNE